jgi:hypothetical protein
MPRVGKMMRLFIQKRKNMDAPTVLGAICSGGIRYFISHANHLPAFSSVVFNATDMLVSGVVSAYFDKQARAHPDLYLATQLVGRVISMFVAGIATAPFAKIELKMMIVLNMTSFFGGVLLRIVITKYSSQQVEAKLEQEGVPVENGSQQNLDQALGENPPEEQPVHRFPGYHYLLLSHKFFEQMGARVSTLDVKYT